ncbi:uncharacterized protein [Nicotiana tomentosiformis]|uniref:uncharacterized protein n=1 Tax=Nicotiana tomentosiformis TaxID=4098 RepID=UPI00388CB188
MADNTVNNPHNPEIQGEQPYFEDSISDTRNEGNDITPVHDRWYPRQVRETTPNDDDEEHVVYVVRVLFGIQKEITCDNGPQFIGAKVTKFLKDLKIKRITSSPYHPSANGQVESINKVIIQNLKKRLEAAKGNWPEELPRVLWACRTTTNSSTWETPFSLVYSAESLILVEVGEPTLRYFQADEESNNKAMLINLELLEERRDMAYVRMAAQKQRMK